MSATGGRRRDSQFGSTLPEVPPSGVGRVRLANLTFASLDLPAVNALADYTAVIADVLAEERGGASGTLSAYVEVVRVNFRDGYVEYTRHGGVYGGRRHPTTGEAEDLPPSD